MQGIYIVKNLINGNIYVGLSKNIERRFMEHKTPKNVTKKTTVLSRSFRKYGLQNFDFRVLEEVENIEDLPAREMYWISTLKPKYNMNDGGLGNRSLIVTDETREVLREKGKQQWQMKTDEEKRTQIINNLKGPKKGHKVSDKNIEALKKANTGRVHSLEERQKRSSSLKGKQRKNEHHYKSVACYLNGDHVDSFDSIKSAALSFNKSPGRISAVLRGRRKHFAGYEWKYIDN